VHRQHRRPREAGIDRLAVDRLDAGRRRQRRGDLREGRQIGLAQHQAGVSVSDQAPLAIDDVGVARLADLDRPHGIPDGFEIDLRQGHAVVHPAMRHGERHVRLGVFLEVDGAEMRLSVPRLNEAHIAGEVGDGTEER
jgi:hypothetical protein